MSEVEGTGGPNNERLQEARLKGKSFGRILFMSGTFAALALFSIPLAVVYLANRDAAYTDVVFPLILVVGVISLVLVVAVLVGLFKRMDLVDGRYALGLPNGSVSAIIALMLILVFAMMSVLVQINMSAEFKSVEMTQAKANQLPAEQIFGMRCDAVTQTCQVDRRIERSPAQVDIGKQLVTTVSTLVVAISAFYFGSVQTANAARRLRRDADTDE